MYSKERRLSRGERGRGYGQHREMVKGLGKGKGVKGCMGGGESGGEGGPSGEEAITD